MLRGEDLMSRWAGRGSSATVAMMLALTSCVAPNDDDSAANDDDDSAALDDDDSASPDDDDTTPPCADDLDGDGIVSTLCGGDDCDDEDAAVHPEALEVCGDGVDNNCDGGPAGCGLAGNVGLESADATLFGGEELRELGTSLAVAPGIGPTGQQGLHAGTRFSAIAATFDDVPSGQPSASYESGDSGLGYPRWLDSIGAELQLVVVTDPLVTGGGFGKLGSLIELFAPQSGVSSVPDIRWSRIELRTDESVPEPSWGPCGLPPDALVAPPGPSLNRSQAGACGDLTGDGREDLCLGAHGTPLHWWNGGVWVFDPWTLPAVASLDHAAAEILGSRPCGGYGYRLDGGQDLTGDERDDLAIGGLSSSTEGDSELTVLAGPLSGGIDPEAAAGTIHAVAPHAGFTHNLVQVADLNGDGVGDVLADAKVEELNGDWVTIVLGFFGPFASDRDTSDADVRILPRSDEHNAVTGAGPAGDVDGDGSDDLLVSLGSLVPPQRTAWASAVCLFYGPVTGDLSADAADFCALAPDLSTSFGQSMAAGDFNGDGFSDIAVGAPQVPNPEGITGAVYIFYGQPRPL
jgi:hypothetical protein